MQTPSFKKIASIVALLGFLLLGIQISASQAYKPSYLRQLVQGRTQGSAPTFSQPQR